VISQGHTVIRTGGSTALGLPTPGPGPGVCATCHGPARDGRADCWCCRLVSARLVPPPPTRPVVVPIRVCRNGDALHAVLRGYKDAPVAAARRHFAARVQQLVDGFLMTHAGCVVRAAGRPWDVVMTVPSSVRTSRAEPFQTGWRHPMERVLAAVVGEETLIRSHLVTGLAAPRHLEPHDAFRPAQDVAGRRVLVFDDSWVTGARARSAVASVERSGATVVAVVVVGRLVDTRASASAARWWSWVEDRSCAPDGEARCCLSGCPGASSPRAAPCTVGEPRVPSPAWTRGFAGVRFEPDTCLYQADALFSGTGAPSEPAQRPEG